jgi:hypothetical protein
MASSSSSRAAAVLPLALLVDLVAVANVVAFDLSLVPVALDDP